MFEKGDLVRYVGTTDAVLEHGYLWVVLRPSGFDLGYWACTSIATGEQIFLQRSNLRKHDDEEG